MFDTLNKIFGSVFKERTSSPFYGTFILSWCVCNWRIIYLTLFVDEELTGNKINIIERYYLSISNLIFWPLASTAVLIWGVPYIANEAYNAALTFSASRRKKMEEMEKNRMLSVEEADEIRRENYDLKEKHTKQITLKDTEINSMRNKISELDEAIELKNHDLERANALADLRQMHRPSTFYVVAAVYGSVLKGQYADVTAALNKNIKEDKLRFIVENDFFGSDPSPGNAKQINIVYRDTTGVLLNVSAQEHQTITIEGNGKPVFVQS
jgi:hypothetical protein